MPSDHRTRAADLATDWRIASHGVEVLAHGALVCPNCDAPLSLAEPVSAGERLACGFCEHRGRAREFLVRDVFDTVANEAYLIARLPA